MTVVGLGTQDSLADAQRFVADHDMTTVRMLWDRGFDSWSHFGIAAQPAAVLFDTDGTVIGSRRGELDTDEVSAALGLS